MRTPAFRQEVADDTDTFDISVLWMDLGGGD